MASVDRKKQGKTAREKGKRNELILMHILNDLYGYETKRGHVFEGEPDIVGLPGIHVEVKAVEKLNIRKALQQSVEDSKKRKDGLPTVFWHKSREGWTVTMRLEDFMELYGRNDGNND